MRLNKLLSIFQSYVFNAQNRGLFDKNGRAELYIGQKVAFMNVVKANDSFQLSVELEDSEEEGYLSLKARTDLLYDFVKAKSKDVPGFFAQNCKPIPAKQALTIETPLKNGLPLEGKRLFNVIKAINDITSYDYAGYREVVHSIILESKDNKELKVSANNGVSLFMVSKPVNGFSLPTEVFALRSFISSILVEFVRLKSNYTLYAEGNKLFLTNGTETFVYENITGAKRLPIEQFTKGKVLTVEKNFSYIHGEAIQRVGKVKVKKEDRPFGHYGDLVNFFSSGKLWYCSKEFTTAQEELGSWNSDMSFGCYYNPDILKPFLNYIKRTGESYTLGLNACKSYWDDKLTDAALQITNDNTYILVMPCRHY